MKYIPQIIELADGTKCVALEDYDKLATENMLEVNEICNQRDAAIDALMKIEDIFIDGDDTYEDWKSMGQIARTFFEKNT
jgi:hypothetical protein